MCIYYRFNALSQCLKGGFSTLSVAGPGRSAATRFVYKPLLSSHNLPSTVAVAPMSSGHDDHSWVPKEWEGWQKWKSWKDVPDHLIPKTSKRDPNNTIYAHPDYIKIRKQQIWFQLPDGKPVWLKLGTPDYIIYYVILVGLAITLTWSMYLHYEEIYLKYYPSE